jgi:hypothetical protein
MGYFLKTYPALGSIAKAPGQGKGVFSARAEISDATD